MTDSTHNNYSNAAIRRQDRLLNEALAVKLLQDNEHGVLSLVDKEGNPYGVPVNYVWDGQNSVFLHCAPEGRKIECIRHHNKVSFSITGKTHVIPHQFTTEYESIILECEAALNLTDHEKMNALSLLIEKYSPDFKTQGVKYAQNSLDRTEIIRLRILQWSGKSKKVAPTL